jgi:hypothetical protein
MSAIGTLSSRLIARIARAISHTTRVARPSEGSSSNKSFGFAISPSVPARARPSAAHRQRACSPTADATRAAVGNARRSARGRAGGSEGAGFVCLTDADPQRELERQRANGTPPRLTQEVNYRDRFGVSFEVIDPNGLLAASRQGSAVVLRSSWSSRSYEVVGSSSALPKKRATAGGSPVEGLGSGRW